MATLEKKFASKTLKLVGTILILITTLSGCDFGCGSVYDTVSIAEISITPKQLNFQGVLVDEIEPKGFVITNQGNTQLDITVSSDNPAFVLDESAFHLSRGLNSKTVFVFFKPTEQKSYNGSITIYAVPDEESGQPPFTEHLQLYGYGASSNDSNIYTLKVQFTNNSNKDTTHLFGEGETGGPGNRLPPGYSRNNE